MLSVVELNDILDEAEAMAAQRRFRALADYLRALPSELVRTEPLTLYLLAYSSFMTGDEVDARECIEKLTATYGEDCNDRLGRRLINLKAIIEIERGNLTTGSELLTRLRAMAESAEDHRYVAYATLNQGIALQMRGSVKSAIMTFQRAIVAFQRLGDQAGLAGCAHNLGISYREAGHFAEAESQFFVAKDHYARKGSAEELVTTDIERALMVAKRGEHDLAEKTARIALTNADALENVRLRAEALRVLGAIAIDMGRYSEARHVLLEALSVAEGHEVVLLEAEVLWELGRLEGLAFDISEHAMNYRGRAEALYKRLGAERLPVQDSQ